jgi:flagellar biosynthetic protein FlhB
MTEFAKSLFKLATIGIVVTLILQSQLLDIINTISIDSATIPEMILGIATRLFSTVAIAVLVLVGADVVWSRFHWRRDLRMSRQEVKDERKETEGDPLVRARLRSLALSRSRKRMMAKVPNATLVIANPTHYAVALRYVREEGGAPVVLAKGQDLIALKIREIAEEFSIPIVEDKALARSLYENVQIGKFIPPEFYRAVAEIVHFLQARAARRPQRR